MGDPTKGANMRKLLLSVALASVISIEHANAACSSYPYTLTNGTPADATQVMANFNCAALTSGTTLENVVRVGIGTVGTNALDVTQSGSSPTIARILNSTIGAGAIAALQVANAAGHTGYFYMFGSAFMPSGMRRADGAYLASDGAGGLTINTDANQPIYFGINSSEVGRFDTAGTFLVGTTTSGGILGNAKVAVVTPGGTGVSVQSTGTTGQSIYTQVASTAQPFWIGNYAGSNVGSITTNGTATACNTTSDERLKNWDIPQKDYERGIRELWVGDFAWKSSGETDFGIRAQQAYRYFPSAVRKPQNEKSSRWEADYSRLAPLAVWGVQKLYQRTDAHQRNIASMQDDVRSLAKELAVLRRMYAESKAETAKLSERLQKLDRGLIRVAHR